MLSALKGKGSFRKIKQLERPASISIALAVLHLLKQHPIKLWVSLVVCHITSLALIYYSHQATYNSAEGAIYHKRPHSRSPDPTPYDTESVTGGSS
jgi:hypothetical protein